MFDAQVDAVRAALDAKGYKDVEIVVAETGWPHKGDPDEAGATVENARAFVSGLVSHLSSLAGTPRAPGKSVVTYIFAMYDEDLKPGKASERYFGLFQTSLTETYPTGLLRNGTAGLIPATVPAPAPTTSVPALKPTPGQQPQVGLQYNTICCCCFFLPRVCSLASCGASDESASVGAGDSRAAGLDGGSWAFRPLQAGARYGYVERDHHRRLRSS
jgi:hypothetical protein